MPLNDISAPSISGLGGVAGAQARGIPYHGMPILPHHNEPSKPSKIRPEIIRRAWLNNSEEKLHKYGFKNRVVHP